MDADVLEVVIGRRLAADAICPARLEGYRRGLVRDESYPVLRATPGASVGGVLVDALEQADVERIAFFEESEYATERVTVVLGDGERVDAHAHTQCALDFDSASDWDLKQWQRAEKAEFLTLARYWMANYGSDDIAAAEAQWDRLKAQLASQRDPGEVKLFSRLRSFGSS